MNASKYVSFSFYKDGKPLDGGPEGGMSVLRSGSMRFRWSEENANRSAYLNELCLPDKKIAAVELIHSHRVYAIEDEKEAHALQGDGIITLNKKIIPVITAADCMPVFIYDPVTQVFGALHSGWKGTGIACDALALAEEKYGSKAWDFSVIMAPHIHECCYYIEEERADFFAKNFSADCVKKIEDGAYKGKYSLSLAEANLAALLKAGVRRDNIFISGECTCCKKDADGEYKFGSFRRQTASLPEDMSLEERQRRFTVQAAWVKW